MGNYASCALTGVSGKQSKAAKVIFPNGEIKQFPQATNAAELMLEIPNYFLVNSKSLRIGKRFSALNADEELENSNVYIMFPMQRVNSFISANDMGVLYMLAKRGSAGKVRVVPASSSEMGSPARVEEGGACEKKLGLEEFCSAEFQHRKSLCRSKKPLLETIVEEPVYYTR